MSKLTVIEKFRQLNVKTFLQIADKFAAVLLSLKAVQACRTQLLLLLWH